MRRTIISLLVIALVVLAVAACSRKTDYQVFMEAMERTERVEMGKMSMEIAVNADFNKEGFSEDVRDSISFFEKLNFSLKDEYNRKKNESLKKIFIQMKETGIDAKLYTRGEVGYVITPLIPKILVIQGEELVHLNSGRINRENLPRLSKESLEQLDKVWTSLYNDENISALEDIVMDTPEGSVKARRYEVKLTDEQLKPALKKSMNILMKDEQLMKGIKEVMGQHTGDISIEEMLKKNIEMLDQATINSFSQIAYIDRDNYVIDERIRLDITFYFSEPGAPTHYAFEMNTKRWDLNKEPKIYFPEVTAENSITLGQLEEKYPAFFEGMKGEKH